MKIPCDQHIACPCTTLLTNYSSEDPDRLLFLARRFRGPGLPPMGRNDPGLDCTTFASSPISEEDADFCAVRHQTICEQTGSGISITSGIAPDPCVFCRPAPPGATDVGLGGVGNGTSFGELHTVCTDDDGNIIPCPDPCCDVSSLPENAADIEVTETDEDGNVVLKCCCNPVPGDPDVPPEEPPDNPDDPDIPTQPQLFGNSPQTCEATCANGGKLSATVGANYFIANSAGLANSMAHSYACRLANERKARLCIGNLPDATVCQQYSQQLITSSPDSRITFSKVAGPGWMSISSSGLVTGRPTAADSNTSELVSIGVTDFDGFTVIQDVFITVNPSGDPCFDNGDPPIADSAPVVEGGVAYSFQLVPHQPAEPAYVYTIVSGGLPPGIGLNTATGLISGKCDTAGFYPVTIGLSGVCEPCQKSYTIEAKCFPLADVDPSTVQLQGTYPTGPSSIIKYIVQRTGANRTIQCAFNGISRPVFNLNTNIGVTVYRNRDNLPMCSAGMSITGGFDSPCQGPNAVVSGPTTASLESCVLYRVDYHITCSKQSAPDHDPLPCAQSGTMVVSWT